VKRAKGLTDEEKALQHLGISNPTRVSPWCICEDCLCLQRHHYEDVKREVHGQGTTS
jgi:hypothetical protein